MLSLMNNSDLMGNRRDMVSPAFSVTRPERSEKQERAEWREGRSGGQTALIRTGRSKAKGLIELNNEFKGEGESWVFWSQKENHHFLFLLKNEMSYTRKNTSKEERLFMKVEMLRQRESWKVHESMLECVCVCVCVLALICRSRLQSDFSDLWFLRGGYTQFRKDLRNDLLKVLGFRRVN